MHIVTVELSYCKLSSFILPARLLQFNAHGLNHQASFVCQIFQENLIPPGSSSDTLTLFYWLKKSCRCHEQACLDSRSQSYFNQHHFSCYISQNPCSILHLPLSLLQVRPNFQSAESGYIVMHQKTGQSLVSLHFRSCGVHYRNISRRTEGSTWASLW
jgi:hypothetical protein